MTGEIIKTIDGGVWGEEKAPEVIQLQKEAVKDFLENLPERHRLIAALEIMDTAAEQVTKISAEIHAQQQEESQ